VIPNHTNSAILVLGDSMLDVYVNGRVDRISPEAPVPVLLRHKETAVAGGAANVAANAVRLGAKAHLVSVTGEDADGDRLAELVVASGAVFHRIAHAGRKTTSKMRVLGDGHQLIRIDQEDLAEIAPESQSAALEFVARLLPKVSVLVISDYAKGMLTDRVIAGAIALARQLSVPVLVDPKRREFSIYRDATLIKPNRAELARASGQSCQTLAEIEAASQKV
jgi:D-beta-D-heptose 7-phosphate kinase/D-beta-D-heptose 1-phosphate adenosyltransferase